MIICTSNCLGLVIFSKNTAIKLTDKSHGLVCAARYRISVLTDEIQSKLIIRSAKDTIFLWKLAQHKSAMKYIIIGLCAPERRQLLCVIVYSAVLNLLTGMSVACLLPCFLFNIVLVIKLKLHCHSFIYS